MRNPNIPSVQAAQADDRDMERRTEREQERQQRRHNAVWSEYTFDDLPDWAHRELEESLHLCRAEP